MHLYFHSVIIPPIMKKGGDSMEEIENLRKELGRLDDMIDMVESKIHNLIGLLELVYQGTKQ